MIKAWKFIKRLVLLAFLGAILYVAIRYYPIVSKLFAGEKLNFRDIRSSVELRDIGKLNSLQLTQSGTFENDTKALFNITANSIWVDYEFRGLYGIDLTEAYVRTDGKDINVYLPKAELTDHSIKILKVSRKDFLKPVTPEDLVRIVAEFKKQLYEQYRTDAANLQKARENAFDIAQNIIKGYLGNSDGYSFHLCDIGG